MLLVAAAVVLAWLITQANIPAELSVVASHLHAVDLLQPRVAAWFEARRIENGVAVPGWTAGETFHVLIEFVVGSRAGCGESLGAGQVWLHAHNIQALRRVGAGSERESAGVGMGLE